jgi:hypothetical protein
MNTLLRLINYLRFSHLDSGHFGSTYRERERFNSAIFISPKRDFLFTKNEKCGSNTARMTLQHLAAEKPLPPNFRDVNRWTAPMLQPSDIRLTRVEDLNGMIPFKFAIVRNPYARLLSCYMSKFAGKPKPTLGKRLGTESALSFPDFVARVCRQEPLEMDPHWRVQYLNIYCDRLHYDYFVRFERYEEEFNELMLRFFGRTGIRSVRKGAKRAELKLGEYYTAELALAVRDKYAIDFETFGYSTDLQRS